MRKLTAKEIASIEAGAPLTVRCVAPCRGVASRKSWAQLRRRTDKDTTFIPIYACTTCGRRVISAETAAVLGTLTGPHVSRVWPSKSN